MSAKLLLSLSAAVLLVGCASPTHKDLVSSSPVAAFTSFKKAKAVAMCIASRWESGKVVGASVMTAVRETETGYRVSMFIGGHLHYVGEVEQAAQGAMTKLYRGPNMVVLGSQDPHAGEVAACQ